MEQFGLAFGRTIAVDELEFDFNNRCLVNSQPTLIFDIRRPTSDGRIYEGTLHVKCSNREWVSVDRLKRLIRERLAAIKEANWEGRHD